jgi:hypothetical protein
MKQSSLSSVNVFFVIMHVQSWLGTGIKMQAAKWCIRTSLSSHFSGKKPLPNTGTDGVHFTRKGLERVLVKLHAKLRMSDL